MSRKAKGTTTKGGGPSKPATPRRRGKGKPKELTPFNKSFTITQFILRNPMPRNSYFKMRAAGRGPVEIRPTGAARGGIVLIPEESERDWRIAEAARNAAKATPADKPGPEGAS